MTYRIATIIIRTMQALGASGIAVGMYYAGQGGF